MQGSRMQVLSKLSEHANERVRTRLAASGLRLTERALERLAAYAATESSAAFKLAQVPGPVGVPMSDESNGDELWAVVRDYNVTTLMFRRSTQPATCGALRVDTVHHVPLFDARELV